MNICFDCKFKTPSHSTVLLWLKKYGFHQLSKAKHKADDWVVILDESVQFGQNKLLLVYGVRQKDIDFTRPLVYQDLLPMVIISRTSWTGDGIKEQLELLQKDIGKISYAVADQGNPIKKALLSMGIFHVYDITHYISLILEHIYKEDSLFKEFTKRLAHLRATQALGKMAHVLPPVQRCKARFMNLKPISDWGKAVLNLLENGPSVFKQEKQALAWVSQYKELISELGALNQLINQIQKVLKNNGISQKTTVSCLGILKTANKPRLTMFKDKLEQHFQAIMDSKQLQQHKELLCCSDIIESAFGKYKNYIHSNPMVGITNLSLSLAAFTAQISTDDLKQAFQQTRVSDISKWTNSNIGETSLSKRLKTLKWNEFLKHN